MERTAESYFNPSTYMVIDRVTGEELNVDIFIEKASVNGWQKAYARTLADYIDCGGNASVKVLAYLIRTKQQNNMIIATREMIAKDSNVSIGTVRVTMKALHEKELIKTVRNGVYLMNPKVLANGNKKVGAMIFRLWGETR